MKKDLKRKIIILSISIILIGLGAACSLFFNPYSSFSVIVVREDNSNLKFTESHKLFKGNKLTGEFKATDNNLGIIFIKFTKIIKSDYYNEDNLLFRIKEKNSKKWYTENKYKEGIIYNNLLFPFGILPISNSKGKIYDFELISLNGNSKNFVEVDNSGSNFASGYQFSKASISTNKKSLITFIFKKLLSSFTNIDFVLNSLIYFLPAFFYIIWHTLLKRALPYTYTLTIISFLFILLDIIFLKEIYSGVAFGILGLLIISDFTYKQSKNLSLILGLLMFIISSILLNHVDQFLTNKLSLWVYLLLLVGIIHEVYLFIKITKYQAFKKTQLKNK